MAIRPVFITKNKVSKKEGLVNIEFIKFKWAPGMSLTQKQKSIFSLHERVRKKYPNLGILEISTKSYKEVGKKLSAFNLQIDLKKICNIKKIVSLESLFQGSKVYKNKYNNKIIGPFTFLYDETPNVAKKHKVEKEYELIYFDLFGQKWELEYGYTAFYDWLYINAVYQNKELFKEMIKYNIFTDIEFNPNKSINCQAYSAALFVTLYNLNLLEKIIKNKNEYLKIIKIYKQKYNYNSIKKINNTPNLFSK